jgi:hypothetical protein
MAALDNPTAPRRLAALGLLLAAGALLAPAGRAQAPGGETYYVRQPEIAVPFYPDKSGRLRQVQLFVSTDQGRDWQFALNANPADGRFPPYVAPADGVYWFAVRVIDQQGRYIPELLEQLTLQKDLRKVVVDRKPPVVSLRQVPERHPQYPADGITVEWDVRDENLDLVRFELTYRMPGGDWQRELKAVPQVRGMQSWRIQPGTRMEVRLRVADRAGNEETAYTTVGLTADGRPLDPPPGAVSGSATGGGLREPVYVNNLQISIPYTISSRPPSGFSAFDLWYSKDKGQKWTKAPREEGSSPFPDSVPASPGGPAEALKGQFRFNADAPGEYGFLIVARNGVGIGSPDPKSGDLPSHRVVADIEKPTVKVKVQRGAGAGARPVRPEDVRNVAIEWFAKDENLIDKPVMIEYAEVKNKSTPPAEADWKPIEGHAGPFDKSGAFTWTVGPKGPFCFYVRARATDKAGNTNTDQWPDAVLVDLEHPSIIIGDVGSAGK